MSPDFLPHDVKQIFYGSYNLPVDDLAFGFFHGSYKLPVDVKQIYHGSYNLPVDDSPGRDRFGILN